MVMFLLPLGDITLIYNVNIFIIYLVISSSSTTSAIRSRIGSHSAALPTAIDPTARTGPRPGHQPQVLSQALYSSKAL